MKNRASFLIAINTIILSLLLSCSDMGNRKITILATTDVHGVILPYDFIEMEKSDASLAAAYTYIRKQRDESDGVILLDNGDNLQGQPEVYYYNFIDTVSAHFLVEVMNYMKYDAVTVGNHDVEAGHAVYDRLVKEYNFPLLAANAVDTKTGKPYFKPYHNIDIKGIRITVFGLITPAVPNWLPPELYEGIEFKDMVETAKLWMPVIMNEKPDLVIGLFHSGWDRSDVNEQNREVLYENGSSSVAYNVPGFDIIFNGHDHRVANEHFVNIAGDTVVILDGGSRAEKIARADITFSCGKRGEKERRITGSIVNVKDFKPDNEFIERFSIQHSEIETYVNREIGYSSATVSSRDAYFGSSAFIDMIHSVQLEVTGADISFAAPLSFDVQIPEGPISVGDMFKLYRFENMLYTMLLSGEEIHNYLEYSYSGWFNTMRGPDDLMLKVRTGKDGKPVLTNGKAWLINQPYNFDSAAGIEYIVDLSKPEGGRIIINGFSNGRPYDNSKIYNVAVNSYRGNGGGGHFTEGAGIDRTELRSRLVSSTDRDLRYYIMKSIESKKTIYPKPFNNWKITPDKWVENAIKREYLLLFGSRK